MDKYDVKLKVNRKNSGIQFFGATELEFRKIFQKTIKDKKVLE